MTMMNRAAETAAALAVSTLVLTAPAQSIGPDVIVAELFDTAFYGESAGIYAYALGTEACNIGDHALGWYHDTPNHPVIAQHMYRIHDGRIEQIGLSLLKHGVAVGQSNTCGGCQPFPGVGELGAGCSYPYSASINGSQAGLGPRFEVNASTGVFPFPFTDPANAGSSSIFKRIQVPAELLVFDETTTYLVEGQYVTPDDAQSGNNHNNASHRLALLSPNFNLALTGQTVREQPAIFAWADHEPDVVINTVDVPADGRFHVAGRAVELGGGDWRYHYAIHNLSSHRSANAIIIPAQVPEVTDPDFHAPHYHSNSPVSNAPWVFTPGNASVRWEAGAYSPATEDSANAVRFGTTYTFSFTAPAPPVTTEVTVFFFRPGATDSLSVPLPTPGPWCVADLAEPFGVLNFSDVVAFLTAFGAGEPEADLAAPFGTFDFSDVTAFLTAFGAGCP